MWRWRDVLSRICVDLRFVLVLGHVYYPLCKALLHHRQSAPKESAVLAHPDRAGSKSIADALPCCCPQRGPPTHASPGIALAVGEQQRTAQLTSGLHLARL